MTQYYEPPQELSPLDRDYVRALMSFKEEIEAVDWYHQRVATCADPQLKAVLAHNRDEEMEHAVMALEWLRRTMPGWDAQLRKYLFTTGDITLIEGAAGEGGTAAPPEVAQPAIGASTKNAPPARATQPSEEIQSVGIMSGLGIGSLKK